MFDTYFHHIATTRISFFVHKQLAPDLNRPLTFYYDTLK